jgi:hypothetical protein
VHEDSDPIRIELGGGAAAFGVEFVTALMLLHLRQETPCLPSAKSHFLWAIQSQDRFIEHSNAGLA